MVQLAFLTDSLEEAFPLFQLKFTVQIAGRYIPIQGTITLFTAAQSGNYDVMKYLLTLNIDINHKRSMDGATA